LLREPMAAWTTMKVGQSMVGPLRDEEHSG
jgi:hypothetical protein